MAEGCVITIPSFVEESFSFTILFSCTFHDFYPLCIPSALSFPSFNKSLIILQCPALGDFLWEAFSCPHKLCSAWFVPLHVAALYWMVGCSVWVSLSKLQALQSQWLCLFHLGVSASCIRFARCNYSINISRNSVFKDLTSLFGSCSLLFSSVSE